MALEPRRISEREQHMSIHNLIAQRVKQVSAFFKQGRRAFISAEIRLDIPQGMECQRDRPALAQFAKDRQTLGVARAVAYSPWSQATNPWP